MTLISGMTEAGLELLAKSQTGKKIFFTRMKVGTGRISENTNFAELTDLINPIEAIEIQASEIIKQNDGSVALKVSSVAMQKDEDYYFREIGLYAIDPDTEDEILYAYINKGEEATYIPRSSAEIAIQELATMIVAIGNENNIIVNCESDLKVIEQIEGNGGYSLFDTVIKDHLLSYEESEGFALQGTYVYKEGIAGERWGYPDFIAECIKEKNEAEAQRMTLGSSTIMCYVHSNGHIYYDISDKSVVDTFFNAMGAAWFYGIDEANERVFLPRNIYFFKSATSNPGQYNAPQLPSLAHSHTLTMSSGGSHIHSVTIGSSGAHTHTRGTMNITGQLSGLSYDQKDSKNGMSGAFSWLGTTKKGAGSGEKDRYAYFNAADSWTGSTSSSGSHSHTATVGSSGSHTHESTISSTNPAGSFTGTTVLPPSVNGLLYIVVGNVRQRSAVVINAELQNAVAMIQARQSLAQSNIDETKNYAISDINSVKNTAINEVELAGAEQLAYINSDLNTASGFAEEAQRQAEIAEQFANLSIAGQKQTDWNQDDTNAVDYIKNKPQCDWGNIVYKETLQTLKNKSISGLNNTISDLPFNVFANGIVLTSLNPNNATNDTLATSSAIINAIYDLPIANVIITNNLSNLDNISDEKIPTTLAVYNALEDLSKVSGVDISGDDVIDVDTNFYTTVTVESSNPDLTVTSSYTGAENKTGTKIYNFIYKANGNSNAWFDENNNIANLNNYHLTVSGTPEVNDLITLKYTTTSSYEISANVADVAVSGSYNDLLHKPIWGNGLVPANNLVTTASVEVSNENLNVSCSYSGTQSSIGTIEYYFTYDSGRWLDDNENAVNLASYNLTVTGTPEEGDIITLTYTTVNQLSVSVNFPSPGNGTLTIQKNGSNVATFGANSSSNVTANISVPTKLSELTDNLGSNPTHTHSQYLTTHQDISGKANSADLARVATSGSYNDLSNKPTTLSSFTDNLGSNPVHTHSQYLTSHQDISGKVNRTELATVATSGSYNDLLNKPTIPTTLSSFTDNLGSNPVHTHSQYLTSHQDISGKANDSAVVHLTGSETITGSKTFSGSVSLGSSATATTQTITDNDTSVSTTAFARALSTHQPITTLSSGSITLTSGISLYKRTPTAATTFTFTLSGTSASSSVAYTFELCIVMSTVYSLTFPSSVIWQNGETPDMSSTGTYLLAFRTLDGGSTWLGNLQGKW